MIRVILLGRTGNNLFQYAIGRTLAEIHQVPLVLDASLYRADGWNEVSHFLDLPIQAKVQRRFSIGARCLNKFIGKHYREVAGAPVIREKPTDLSFDQRILEAPNHCVLRGYFQTVLYFETIENQLREELSRLIEDRVRLEYGNSELFSLDGAINVAVHVRRGDYLTQRLFQVCERNYYHSSMDRIRALAPGAKFIVFSDEPEWCSTEFTGADLSVAEPIASDQSPLVDLFRMSSASHHIIANSSYSWWAAWLGKKDNQIVICPDRWYQSGIRAPIQEKLCEDWLTQSTA